MLWWGGTEPLIIKELRREGTDIIFDKSYDDVYQALANGVPCYYVIGGGTDPVSAFPVYTAYEDTALSNFAVKYWDFESQFGDAMYANTTSENLRQTSTS